MSQDLQTKFLDMLDEALDDAIRRYRAVHHASLAELHEMKQELEAARDGLERAMRQSGEVSPQTAERVVDQPIGV